MTYMEYIELKLKEKAKAIGPKPVTVLKQKPLSFQQKAMELLYSKENPC